MGLIITFWVLSIIGSIAFYAWITANAIKLHDKRESGNAIKEKRIKEKRIITYYVAREYGSSKFVTSHGAIRKFKSKQEALDYVMPDTEKNGVVYEVMKREEIIYD